MSRTAVSRAGILRAYTRIAMAQEVEAPRRCPHCGHRQVLPVSFKEEAVGLCRWAYQGMPLEDALPGWAGERHRVLLTGECLPCQRASTLSPGDVAATDLT